MLLSQSNDRLNFFLGYRSMAQNAVSDIFGYVQKKFVTIQEETPELMNDPEWLKTNVSFIGEVLMGHLRYGTHGQNSIENCHPFLRHWLYIHMLRLMEISRRWWHQRMPNTLQIRLM